MCGFAGIFAYGDQAAAPDRAELITIRDHMSRRGPDGTGEWWDEARRIGLGHRRLAIIDLNDRALQPMTSDDGHLAILFNGEIYNYAELKRDLEAEGHRFRTTSDTEVILHLYAAEGAAMLKRLRGMFAMALWDGRKRGLFLARDPYGIKPLYIADEGGTLRFASQVKALLAGGAVSRDPDPAGLAGFQVFGHVPEPFTSFKAIRPVPAGCSQWVDAAGCSEPLPCVNLAQVARDGAASPAAGDFQEVIRSAALGSVRAHLVADVEVGCFLSAGIDSGALVGLMRDAGQEKIRTVTLAFDEFRGGASDESVLASKVAQHYGTNHTTRRVGREEFTADLPLIVETMDQPSVDGVNTWFVSKAARELGLKVALSGVGGDELLAGYSTFSDLPRWRRLFGPLAAIPGAAGAARRMLRLLAPGFAARNPKALGLLDYSGSWAGVYLLRRAMILPAELSAREGDALLREGLETLDPVGLIRRSITPDPGSISGRITILESANYMKNQLLRDSDWAGMAHSLEVRTPLVDIKLLTDLAPLLPRMRAEGGKLALARSPTNPLPDYIANRAKTGFGVPMEAWVGQGSTANNRLTSRQWAEVVGQ